MGPIFLDLNDTTLSAEERELIQHPQVGGLLFFARNYESPAQLKELVREVRAHSRHPLLLTVDQEGGRVQRFQAGLTPLPPLGKIGTLYLDDPVRAELLAQTHGWLMASELLTLGVDLSFAPVLDLDKQLNSVIGWRALHCDPNIVVKLGRAVIRGIQEAGMRTVGKHFPGHGSVTQDTHTEVVRDFRDYDTIAQEDLRPFIELSSNLDALMAAHIIYEAIDNLPCGLSSVWLQTILRDKLQFKGTIFTDDLSMQGAHQVGDILERVSLAWQAGVDGLLICNHRQEAIAALEYLERTTKPLADRRDRLQNLLAPRTLDGAALPRNNAWQRAVRLLSEFNEH